MPDPTNNNVPWPIWATVSIIVALIGAWAIRQANHRDPMPTTPASVSGVSEKLPSAPVEPTPPSSYRAANITSTIDARSAPVRFAIHDGLGSAQEYEAVRVLIDGRHIGTLQVSTDKPFATLHGTVPASGRYSWSASAEAIFMDDDGGQFTRRGSGQGTILIEENSSFTLRATDSGTAWTIILDLDEPS